MKGLVIGRKMIGKYQKIVGSGQEQVGNCRKLHEKCRKSLGIGMKRSEMLRKGMNLIGMVGNCRKEQERGRKVQGIVGNCKMVYTGRSWYRNGRKGVGNWQEIVGKEYEIVRKVRERGMKRVGKWHEKIRERQEMVGNFQELK